MNKKVKCWEVFECKEEGCPAYDSKELICWLIPRTRCRSEIQGQFLEKMEMCLECEPFKANIDFDSMEETLKVVNQQLKEFGRRVEEREKELEGTNMDNWPGIRDISEAACVLTWRYFFPERPVPKAIVLIGDRDVWRWAEEETGPFNESLYSQDHQADNTAFWKPLLENDQTVLAKMIEEGAWLREISLRNLDQMMTARSFEVRFEGHRTIAVNTRGNGDVGNYGRDRGYEIVYTYIDEMQVNGLTTVVTLFSKKIDVSLIAKRYGGGGHAGAAGFSFPRAASPFPPDSDVVW